VELAVANMSSIREFLVAVRGLEDSSDWSLQAVAVGENLG